MSSSASSSSRPLNRGAACLPCRKLKAKCDGGKPTCNRCLANSRPDDCEYATGAEVTRSRLLEENIALLEARIRELENPGEGAPSVQLHDPRRRGSTASAAPSARVQAPLATQSAVLLYPASGDQRGANTEPSPQDIQALIQTFMLHASQLGLFLNRNRFRRPLTPCPASDALMATVYLWGSKLSPYPALRSRETAFADRATQAVMATQTTAPAPTGVLFILQAEVLLANYFFTNDRLLEARYHALAAIALATGSQLHQLDARMLSAMGDTVAVGERIRAFWTTTVLDKAWAAAANMPSTLSQSGRATIQVSTPWPLSMEAYEQGMIVQRNANYSVSDYIRGGVDDSGEEFSALAVHAKAAALYDRAVYIGSQYRADAPDAAARVAALDALIQRTHGALSALRSHRSPDDARALLVARTLLCTASIQLQAPLAGVQLAAYQRSVCAAVAASRALEIIDVNQYPHLDPVMAILWTTICRTLIGELRRGRQGAAPVLQGEAARVTSSLDKIIEAMGVLSRTSPLMASHLVDIQRARASP